MVIYRLPKTGYFFTVYIYPLHQAMEGVNRHICYSLVAHNLHFLFMHGSDERILNNTDHAWSVSCVNIN